MSTVFLSSYDPSWQSQYEKEEASLQKAFHGLPITLHHIGSTSIPGCKAKPILDILGIVSDVTAVDAFNKKLKERGYHAKGEFGMRRRRYFSRETFLPAHLHFFEDTDPEVDRHLRFCDYLRSHPDQVKAYSDLKLQLVKKYSKERALYCLKKTPFIKQIDCLAALEGQPSVRKWGAKRQTWTKEQIQDAMLANMLIPMTYFAKYVPSQEIIFEPDVTVVRAQMQDDTFNYIVDAKFGVENISERIQTILSHFQRKSLPFSWWVGEQDTPPNLAEHLKAAGLTRKEDDIGMFMSIQEEPRKQTPLVIEQVEDQERLKDFATVFVELSRYEGIYKEYYKLVPPILYQPGAPFEMYVAYERGVPVSTGLLVLHANVAGIYYIMTRPSYRRKGYGTTMMYYLLSRAQNAGFHLATLQASEEGKNLYSGMGFCPVCRFTEYSL